ncbi:MFS transporter [Candidatus Uhrbacteria bacterium]|nr:MFS transporter [Candidatus Uhrbacteria bacterium]
MFHIDFKKIAAFTIRQEKKFLPTHAPRELKKLYVATTILNFALAAGVLFEPIYLYSNGYPVWWMALFYLGVYAVYFFLMPLGGKVVMRKGFEHGIMYGSAFLILYLIFLLNIGSHPLFIALAILASAFQKTMFWPGYHADFAYFSQADERAKEIGIIAILDSVAYVLGPLVGGIVVSVFGFTALFAGMSVVILLSNIPLLITRERFSKGVFPYMQPYKDIVAKKNLRETIGYLGFGEELIVLLVWPVFIYVTIQDYLQTGLAVATSTLITSLVILYVGRLSDGGKQAGVYHVGVVFVALAWVFRLLVRGAPSVIMVDLFSRVSKYVFALPFFSRLYAEAKNASSVVRIILYFEMALVVGKISALMLVFTLFYFFGEVWWAAFLLGGLYSLLYFAIDGSDRREYEPPISNMSLVRK